MAAFPSVNPDYPIDETPSEPDVLISRHRDGSEQRRLKGTVRLRTWRIRFGTVLGLTEAERDQIDSHYAGQNGVLTAFQWTHPETTETVLVRYGERPRYSHFALDMYTVDVSFVEVPA